MKNVIIILFLLLGVIQLQAQEWNFGVKGGLNVSSFTGSDADDMGVDSRTGFHAGGLIEGRFSESFGAQMEILYNSLGAKWEGLIDDGSGNEFQGELTFKIDYISVPVLFKYLPMEEFFIETGPQVSFKTTSEIEAEAEGVTVSLDSEEETNNVDFAWVLGLGYDLPYGLIIQARYFLGMSDIYDDTDMKHSVFQVSMGYKF